MGNSWNTGYITNSWRQGTGNIWNTSNIANSWRQGKEIYGIQVI